MGREQFKVLVSIEDTMHSKYLLILNLYFTLAIAAKHQIDPIKNHRTKHDNDLIFRNHINSVNTNSYMSNLSDNKDQLNRFLPNNINNNKKVKHVERLETKFNPNIIRSMYNGKFVQKGKKSIKKNNTNLKAIPFNLNSKQEKQDNKLKTNTNLRIPSNHKFIDEGDNKYSYMRDHPPEHHKEESKAMKNTDKINKEKEKPKNTLEVSPDGERIEFQVQGHDGPQTYIFGYDTGDGKNRQYRLEERTRDGTVKGHYGYYDARGKLRTIQYKATPSEGYKEIHHESII